MEDFIRRNFAGQKSAQAKDRRKKLERIEHVDQPREIAAPPMSFPAATRTGDIVLRVERLAKAYDRPLFKDLSFDILRGEKWGVFGSQRHRQDDAAPLPGRPDDTGCRQGDLRLAW